MLQSEKVAVGQKRHTPITFGNEKSPIKRSKEDNNSKGGKREIYTPPSGKFSSNISSNYGKFLFILIINLYNFVY